MGGTYAFQVGEDLRPEGRPKLYDARHKVLVADTCQLRVERDHPRRDEVARIVLERRDSLAGRGGDYRRDMAPHELVEVLSVMCRVITHPSTPTDSRETYIGTRNGSSLNRGRMRTCSDAHGLSAASAAAAEGPAPDGGAICDARAMFEGVAESEGARAREGRWASVPRRCISRETSLESYVRVVDAYKRGEEEKQGQCEIKGRVGEKKQGRADQCKARAVWDKGDLPPH